MYSSLSGYMLSHVVFIFVADLSRFWIAGHLVKPFAWLFSNADAAMEWMLKNV